MSVFSAETVRQHGFDIIGRTTAEVNGNDPHGRGKVFDEIAGQAALIGTLSVPLLLQFIRPYVVRGEVPCLDAFAHVILDL